MGKLALASMLGVAIMYGQAQYISGFNHGADTVLCVEEARALLTQNEVG